MHHPLDFSPVTALPRRAFFRTLIVVNEPDVTGSMARRRSDRVL